MKESRTHVANIRVDIRAFATVYLYFVEKGFHEVKFSKGKAISLAFKFFERLVVKEHPEYEFTKFSNAVEFLERENVMDTEGRFINKLALIKELQKESLIEEIDSHAVTKAKIRKTKKDLPEGIPSQQSLESIQAVLDKEIAEDPEVIVNKESLAQAEERRVKEEEKSQEAFEDIIKEKKGEEDAKA